MTIDLFYKLYHDAQKQPDCELYIAEFGYPDYFDEISEDANEVVQVLTEIHKLTHMTIKDIVKQSGLSQTAFAKAFDIPYRTVQDWRLGNRQVPEYIKIMILRLLGLTEKIEIQTNWRNKNDQI